MNFIKKKKIQIFTDGSLTTTKTFFKQSNKIKIYNKDHTTFQFYKNNSDFISNSKNFITFKTKYLKF
jgi:hypothetical protein